LDRQLVTFLTITLLFCYGYVPLSATLTPARLQLTQRPPSLRIIVQFARRHRATRPRPRFPYFHHENSRRVALFSAPEITDGIRDCDISTVIPFGRYYLHQWWELYRELS